MCGPLQVISRVSTSPACLVFRVDLVTARVAVVWSIYCGLLSHPALFRSNYVAQTPIVQRGERPRIGRWFFWTDKTLGCKHWR